MDTTATNKRIRELISDLDQRRLIPNPKFQRRLVWSQKHKAEFVKTVLEGMPFPEIYIAAGDVDVNTGQGHSMLVDGQQRITTLYEYFKGSPNLDLPAEISPYSALSDPRKKNFLEYKVVVRDLGQLPVAEVIDIFQRINSTSYSLNAIEVANARYDNDLKDLAEEITKLTFWDVRRIFRLNEVKRMMDVNFALIVITTMMSDYYNRDDRVEEFLIRYNDSFDRRVQVKEEAEATIGFIDELQLPEGSRAWQRADLFTLLIEVHRILYKDKIILDQKSTRDSLNRFYELVDEVKHSSSPQTTLGIGPTAGMLPISENDLSQYYRASLQASNDRGSRIERGRILRRVLGRPSLEI
jgi:hypothetical protein